MSRAKSLPPRAARPEDLHAAIQQTEAHLAEEEAQSAARFGHDVDWTQRLIIQNQLVMLRALLWLWDRP